MKKLTKLFAIFAMLMAGVACSEPDDYNPIIDVPTKGNSTNNNYNDKEKLSIVGTWRYIQSYEIEGQTIYSSLTYVFNQNGSGSASTQMPNWSSDDTIEYVTQTTYLTYSYEHQLGVLTIQLENEPKREATAFIVSDGKTTVLHMDDYVFRKIQ